MPPQSAKTIVIEHLFQKRYDPATGTVEPAVVTFDDLALAIAETNANLSTRNLANFWKDIVRVDPEPYWPATVLEKGFTGDDAIGLGDQASFRFLPLPAGQATAFPRPLSPSPQAWERIVDVQSLSMPVATKALGRADENWVTQVAVRLGVVETHFARFSQREVAEITFLQTGVKLRQGEVDAAYSLDDPDGNTWLVSAEVKKANEGLWPAQVSRAALALATSHAGESAVGVIPFALKLVGPSELWTIEFEPVTDASSSLRIASEGIVRLTPAVRGL
jgi:hypothetical protein